MSLTVRQTIKLKYIIKDICRTASTVAKTASVSKAPEYPPIVEVSERARRQRKFEEWKDQVQKVKTVEEKLIKVNMPKYYGWESVMLSDTQIPYNALPFVQHCTKTHVIQQEQLPDFYKHLRVFNKQLFEDIKSQIVFILQLELQNVRRGPSNENLPLPEQENLITTSVVQQINRIISNTLSKNYQHIFKSQVDLDPRHEAFWFAGGFKPTPRLEKTRENDRYQKEFKEEPVDLPVQYAGSPALTLRSELPLLPILTLEEVLALDVDIPVFDFNPKVIGYNREFRYGTNIPGFWPGDLHRFGLLSYNTLGYILNRPPTFTDTEEALISQAILQSFGWLHSQACYQGFSTYNELTYPFVTQNVITNGQFWSFYVYQLNTTLNHGKFAFNNPRKNVCWATPSEKLFDGFDNDGSLIGFNDNVLENLIKFYINTPQDRNINYTPYLGEDEKLVADIEHDDKRQWLEKTFKYLMSNRPRNKLQYEIYDWERIYKIDHKTRQLEARRRPFELKNNNPIAYRRLDDTLPKYVPKKLRPEGTKKKSENKWEITYYP